MKTKICVLVLLAVYFGISCSPPKNTSNWNLVWEENFDGTDIDFSVWSKIPRGLHDWNNYMSDYDSLYAVVGGNLILRGMQNTVLPNDTAPFITGGVSTKGKKTFGLGRLEIRAKLNGATGAWPAFWMLPEEAHWPMGGEIDIMERLGFDDFVYQTVHTNFTYNLRIKTPANGDTATINALDYNVYAVEKYQDSLVFFVNDTRTFAYPRIETQEDGQFPFVEQEFYLMLDMQLGGQWVGAVNPHDLPVEIAIDWVRFYEQK